MSKKSDFLINTLDNLKYFLMNQFDIDNCISHLFSKVSPYDKNQRLSIIIPFPFSKLDLDFIQSLLKPFGLQDDDFIKINQICTIYIYKHQIFIASFGFCIFLQYDFEEDEKSLRFLIEKLGEYYAIYNDFRENMMENTQIQKLTLFQLLLKKKVLIFYNRR